MCEIVKAYGKTSKKETLYCLECQKEICEMCKLQSQAAKDLMIKKCKEVIDGEIEFTHVIRMK